MKVDKEEEFIDELLAINLKDDDSNYFTYDEFGFIDFS